jgi:hypothetical protein
MIGRVEGAGPGELNLNVESYVLAYVQMILGTISIDSSCFNCKRAIGVEFIPLKVSLVTVGLVKAAHLRSFFHQPDFNYFRRNSTQERTAVVLH